MEKIDFVSIGDSISVGVGNGNKSFVDILGGTKLAVGGKASHSSEIKEAFEKGLELKPKYMVIFIGINNPMSTKGCKDGWEKELIDDLDDYYKRSRKNGSKVIGVTLLPAVRYWKRKYDKCLSGEKYCCKDLEKRNPKLLFEKTKLVNKWIRKNADIVIDAEKELTDKNGILAKYDKDGIHPNGDAQNWIANEIVRKIKRKKKVKRSVLIIGSLVVVSVIGFFVYKSLTKTKK
jgi:lysophospholipase L1-like esterase